MNTDHLTEHDYREYRGYWNTSLQKLEELHQEIVMGIHALDDKYATFESVYDLLKTKVDSLSSIYASYNSIEGREYVLRLKALVDAYRRRYTRDGIRFDLVDQILDKIQRLREKSFEEFPLLHHQKMPLKTGKESYPGYAAYPYKWITFENNASWFIARYCTMQTLNRGGFEIISREKFDYMNIRRDSDTLSVKDFFHRDGQDSETAHVIILDDGRRSFAARTLGRRIYAKIDIISPIMVPFGKSLSNPLANGRVKLFGIHHIVIK